MKEREMEMSFVLVNTKLMVGVLFCTDAAAVLDKYFLQSLANHFKMKKFSFNAYQTRTEGKPPGASHLNSTLVLTRVGWLLACSSWCCFQLASRWLLFSPRRSAIFRQLATKGHLCPQANDRLSLIVIVLNDHLAFERHGHDLRTHAPRLPVISGERGVCG